MFKQRKYVSQSGKEYTFQHPGVRSASQISDRCKNKHGVQQEYKIAEEMMQHVIVSPKITWDYFGDNKQEFNDVIGAAASFMEGVDDDKSNADEG
ncbi:hypothetical protein E0485_15190 [Paenibacillus albiflavus]|uniref:Uncharacterized protein n=1 Tax=Paenibacillus albiflavus TaxID=2545760 RepID=A0A4R4E9D9_9BACL|nr:hypothetical protein [Paenibacillus albiflavus]TCZ76179.1 hypothetical protein E0485_15190 [Paenibacillus albiflavus]